MVEFPCLFVNFKAYPEATGRKAVLLARQLEKASIETGKSIVLCVQASDVFMVSQSVSIPVFAQHFDFFEPGSRTGHTILESLIEAGAKGSLLNHAENKRDNQFIERCLKRSSKKPFEVLLCTESIERMQQFKSFTVLPDMIAIEPPELIGGNVSVSTAKPELVSNSVALSKNFFGLPVITGAGIKSVEDVKKALELGTKGVLVASGIVKAKNAFKEALALLKGLE